MLVDVRIARTLLAAGCPIDHINKEGECAFSYAATNGKSAMVALLLNRRVTVPTTIGGAPMRTALSTVVQAHLFFATTEPDVLLPDCVTIIITYLIPDVK